MKRRPCASTGFAIVERGSLVNVRWKEGWYVGTVQNYTNRGTHIKYNDGQSKYHDLLAEEYVVLRTAKEAADERECKDKLYDAGKEALMCVICMEVCRLPVTAACMHSFCEECVGPLFETKSCPYRCDVRINSMRDLKPNPSLRKLCAAFHPESDDAVKTTQPVVVLKKMRKTPHCRACGIEKRYNSEPCKTCVGGARDDAHDVDA